MTDRTTPERASDTSDSSETRDEPATGAGGERDELEQIADRTSERVQPDDPYTEPPNSTVDDWLGQRVERDADRLADDDGADDGADDDAAPTER